MTEHKVWVYVDHFRGIAHPGSWEAVAVGRELAASLGTGLATIVLGHEVSPLAEEAGHFGADEVLLVDDAVLEDFRAAPYATLITRQAKEGSPEIILFPTTSRGRELAAMCAIDLDTGVLPDVTELALQDGKVVATRPVYAGKVFCRVQCRSLPQIVTLRIRSFPKPEPDPGRTAAITPVPAGILEEDIPLKVLGYTESDAGMISLTEANIIVSGGRGVANNPNLSPPPDINDEKELEVWRAQQGFKMLAELVELLGGALGASRAAVDAGYIPYAHQVGQTGKVVSPDLYIACGISGAIQHQAGMRTSKNIVAINKDPDAPIFRLARFGVVGDLWQIIPALTEALRERL